LIGKPNSIVDPPFQERAKSLVFYSQSLSITKRSASGFDTLSMRLRHFSTSDFVSTYSGSTSSYYRRQESIPLTLWDMQRMGQESGQGRCGYLKFRKKIATVNFNIRPIVRKTPLLPSEDAMTVILL
jgi:hypothetical protein